MNAGGLERVPKLIARGNFRGAIDRVVGRCLPRDVSDSRRGKHQARFQLFEGPRFSSPARATSERVTKIQGRCVIATATHPISLLHVRIPFY
jgi:hypothetical protein